MKKYIKKLFVFAAVLSAFSISASAQTGGKAERVKFGSGASSATVSGRIVGKGSREFVVTARRGQRITVVVKSRSKAVYVSMDVSDVYKTRSTYRTIEGDNNVEIFNESSKSANYTLTITIK